MTTEAASETCAPALVTGWSFTSTLPAERSWDGGKKQNSETRAAFLSVHKANNWCIQHTLLRRRQRHSCPPPYPARSTTG